MNYEEERQLRKEVQAAGAEVLRKKLKIDRLHKSIDNEMDIRVLPLLGGRDTDVGRLRERALDMFDASEKLIGAIDEYVGAVCNVERQMKGQ